MKITYVTILTPKKQKYTDMNKVLDYIDRHYNDAKNACMAHCASTGKEWSEDVFHDTLLKVNDIYERHGLSDESDAGILNYIWMSFRTNIIREKQYKNNQGCMFTDAYGGTTEDEEARASVEMFNDFAVDYIYHKIEECQDITPDEYNIYRLKTIGNKTYAQMQQKYGWPIHQLRQSVTKVRRFIRQNINKQDIKNKFYELYN